MTHPIPGADSELTALDKELMPKRAAFLEFCKTRALDVAERKDAWGNRTFVQSHVEAMWYGWFNAPAAKVGANVAAESIANDPKFQRALATYWQNSTEESRAKLIEVIDHRIAAGAPAETPKQSHAEWVLRQISQLAPHQGATAIFMATEGLAAQPAPAATYCDSINNFLSETLEIPEKQTAFRDRFSKWLNLGCPLPDATPIAGDVEKDAAMLDFLGSRLVVSLNQYEPTHGAPFIQIEMDDSTLVKGATVREAIAAAMLANSSSGEAG